MNLLTLSDHKIEQSWTAFRRTQQIPASNIYKIQSFQNPIKNHQAQKIPAIYTHNKGRGNQSLEIDPEITEIIELEYKYL